MTCPDTPAPLQALVVLGRGGYGGAVPAEMTRLCERLRQLLPQAHVALAWVDRASPGLPEALDECLRAMPQAQHILVQPAFAPTDAALLRWLEKVAQRWRHRQAQPDALPRVVFGPALAELPQLAELLADQLAQAPALPDVVQNQPEHWHSDPQAWSEVPAFQQHLLLCMGPRCTALGAASLWHHLRARLRGHPQLKRTVMPLHTSCQYPCNLGPLMISYPEGLWWGRLDEAAIDAIVGAGLVPEGAARAHLVHRHGADEPQQPQTGV
ncbi:(2Fe-2S) ferredoxin domain-containing protein [Pulveribacter suum]|uniref:Cobalamin biosynthesis protein CbiX n=1 Tax=Pulveribacter suum TaxID=2116657 RepID=A0A2P1NNB3_9BURK|nr:(2Fe-2S) ferredoxin domain-containing protein [Pulveribacter suum]AVP58496.1 cobalamin biosynthesis protein CbiX [Pulveribacter suum]